MLVHHEVNAYLSASTSWEKLLEVRARLFFFFLRVSTRRAFAVCHVCSIDVKRCPENFHQRQIISDTWGPRTRRCHGFHQRAASKTLHKLCVRPAQGSSCAKGLLSCSWYVRSTKLYHILIVVPALVMNSNIDVGLGPTAPRACSVVCCRIVCNVCLTAGLPPVLQLLENEPEG